MCGRKAEAGQALVETAILMPVMIFVVLGALQVMLIEHGRVMTEYAAYNAARAGIVHNGNWNVMRNAALISALPLYQRTDDPAHFLVAWAKVKAVAEITEAVDTGAASLERVAGDLLGVELPGLLQDLSLIEVEVTNPTRRMMTAWESWAQAQERVAQRIDENGKLAYPPDGRELDFDDVEFLKDFASKNPGKQAGELAVNVRILYPLKIPLVNKIMFELWLAMELLGAKQVSSDLTEWSQFKAHVASGRDLSSAVSEAPGQGPTDDFFSTSQWTKEIRTLRSLATEKGVYLLPLKASYAMQMQSNFFEGNRREPVWFTIE